MASLQAVAIALIALTALAVALQAAPQQGLTLVYVVEVVVESGGAVAGWERIVYRYSPAAGGGAVVDYYVTGVHMAPQDAVAVLEGLLASPPEPLGRGGEPLVYAVEGEVLPYKCTPAGEAPISFVYRGRVVDLRFEGEVSLAPETHTPLSAFMEARTGEIRLPGGAVLRDVVVRYTASLAAASEPFCGEPVAGDTAVYALTALALAVTVAAVAVFLGRDRLRVY